MGCAVQSKRIVSQSFCHILSSLATKGFYSVGSLIPTPEFHKDSILSSIPERDIGFCCRFFLF